jgi:hypothetical protein
MSRSDVTSEGAVKRRDRIREMEDELVRIQARWRDAWGQDAERVTAEYQRLHAKWVALKNQGVLNV